MQKVSDTYKEIYASNAYYTETRLDIAGTTHGEDEIFSLKTTRRVFSADAPMVGCAVGGEIDCQILMPSETIPRMAEIRPHVRLVSSVDDKISEWIPKGLFFIDTREVTHNSDDLDILTVHGYDAMLKAGAPFPSNTLTWPQTNHKAVVKLIADTMGVKVDDRTNAMLTKTYAIQLPAEYTMQETLGFIAGMYGGNFIINDAGELMLVTLYGLPEETFLLIDEYDNYITFGGVRIYLGE